jgi:hypothetical protein
LPVSTIMLWGWIAIGLPSSIFCIVLCTMIIPCACRLLYVSSRVSEASLLRPDRSQVAHSNRPTSKSKSVTSGWYSGVTEAWHGWHNAQGRWGPSWAPSLGN